MTRISPMVFLFAVFGALCFAVMSIAAESSEGTPDAEYRKAVELLQNRQNAEAYALFSKLLQQQGGNGNYQLGKLAAAIELAKVDKERGNKAWKVHGKEAAVSIKQLYRSHLTNPEYYLISSRYYALVEREREVEVALKKAIYYRADYAEVGIAKGDDFFWLARMTDSSAIKQGATIMSTSQNNYLRQFKAETAREGYETALKGSGLVPARAAYACFMLAEVEGTIFFNEGKAMTWRKRAVELAPESYWGKKAAEALRAQRD